MARRSAAWCDRPTDAPAGPVVVRPAPAKLNLYLHVTGRRPDGYHLLDSLVAFASLGDEVTVAEARRPTFTVEGEFADGIPSGDAAADNLVVKAACLLAELLDRPPHVAIHLRKSLPPASGIGGGSADAAATLRALACIWGIEEDDPRLAELGGRLGADVPVCLVSRTSRVLGIGDLVEPAPSLSGVPIVLVNPMVPVSTPEVFRRYSGRFTEISGPIDPPADPSDLAGWLAQRRNDLAGPAAQVAPAIEAVLAELAGEPDCRLARMSGSGATCFGLFRTRKSAMAAAERIERGNPDWWVRSGTLL